MKKLFSIIAISMLFTFAAYAQDAVDSLADDTTLAQTEQVEATTPDVAVQDEAAAPAEKQTFHQVLKVKFIEGGAGFMAVILLCLIFGVAICIERIIYLNLADTNTEKLISSIEEALAKGSIKEAKEIARDTRGPVGSIFYQGLERLSDGESLDMVEKSVTSYGGVEMGRLEKNISWISLFIAVAPMFGFMGTVIGMIEAFDNIEAAGDIQPSLVAGGIKIALLTTVFGLIVAIILQFFYNYIISIIDDVVNKMEDASISLMDILVKYEAKRK